VTSPLRTPYSTIVPYFQGAVPSWLPPLEANRIRSYGAYEDLYWNNPNSFKLVQRGSEDDPIYVPSARVIVETINRYVAKDMDFVLMPDMGSDQERQLATQTLTALFNRERFWSRFAAAKRFGIIRGDWCFHITADPAKPQGSRLSINSLDPGMYFPIPDPSDVDSILACDIAEAIVVKDKTYVKRLRYAKDPVSGKITSQTLVLDPDGWNTETPKLAKEPEATAQNTDLVELPAEITALPVYHIRNFEEPRNPFGSSEIRGLERLIAAVNQGASDEELVLAMEGLGAYTTTAGAPVDDNGNDMPWRLGPGRVIELPEDGDFTRVNGVNTVGPYQDHLKYLHDRLDDGSSVSNVAKGTVDVSIAESGIALALRFGPILDLAGEKDILVKDVMRQFIYDLRIWIKLFDGVNLDNILWDVTMGPKLPVDREKEADRWQSLADAGYISLGTLHAKLRELGYDIPDAELANIVAEQNTLAEAGAVPGGTDNTQQVGTDLAAEAAGASNPPAGN
jgi:hypothetical protein